MLMADKERRYSIYGSRTGADAGELAPPDGVHQAEEWLEKMELKPGMLALLNTLNLRYPIGSKSEFLSAIKADVQTGCEISGKKMTLKDMISLLKESDFPIRSGSEAASLLAQACPVPARSII